jgi:putative membrane protein
MSDTHRRPGRVVAPSTPLDGSGLAPQQKQAAGDPLAAIEPADRTRAAPDTLRVHAPATPIKDEMPTTEAQLLELDAAAAPRKAVWTSLFWLLLATVAFWGFGSATLTLVELWQQQILLALPITCAGAALLVLLARALRLEWRALREVDSLALRRSMVEAAKSNNDLDALQAALKPSLDNLQQRYPALLEEFNAAAPSRIRCDDYLELFENLLLSRLDNEAETLINRSAVITGTSVAVVPHPAFDAMVVLWRALVMTRELSRIYGLSPTSWSSWRLMKHSLASAMLAAGMEALGNLALDETGRGVFESAGKKLAEGLIIGSRIRRLGLLTQSVCRPLNKTTRAGERA